MDSATPCIVVVFIQKQAQAARAGSEAGWDWL